MHLLRRMLPPCPPMQINDPEHSKFAIWVGGKNSNARSKPTFHKLVASGFRIILRAGRKFPRSFSRYSVLTRKTQRTGSVLESGRANWLAALFEKTGLPFTKYHIDNWRGGRANLNASAHIRF